MRVLILEDNEDKCKEIARVLLSVGGIEVEDVDRCGDLHSARVRLRSDRYDLLILDVMLPDRIDSAPSPDGGLRLLREISERDGRYRLPVHIVGLTALDTRVGPIVDSFSQFSWSAIEYDASSTGWSEQLKQKAEHVLSCSKQAGLVEAYRSELAIICALNDPELSAVKRLPWGWATESLPGDPTLYLRGCYQAHGSDRLVHAAHCSRMGMPAAAVLAMKLIHGFRPRYLAMVGIAAGVHGKASPGDVLVADPTWDYGNGKYLSGDTPGAEGRFASAPHQIPLDIDLRSSISRLAESTETLLKIKEAWPGDRPSSDLRVLIGPMPSGAAVIADGRLTKKVVDQHRNLIGLEMEAYGAFVAALECSTPRPKAISLKAVCDFADGSKDDRYQRYASHTSARVLAKLFMDFV